MIDFDKFSRFIRYMEYKKELRVIHSFSHKTKSGCIRLIDFSFADMTTIITFSDGSILKNMPRYVVYAYNHYNKYLDNI